MNQKLRNLVYTAMLMALCCVATLVIKIPTVTGGYLNAGDIVVVLAALLAGPLYGGVAAGFGSGLADVISGYMSYAPGTLVVKGCAAVVAALIFRACRKKSFCFALLSAICGEIIMVLGYFVFEESAADPRFLRGRAGKKAEINPLHTQNSRSRSGAAVFLVFTPRARG